MPPKTYNLSAFADRLGEKKQYRVLAHKIRQAVRFSSLRADLQMAYEACDAFMSHSATVNEYDYKNDQAIISYALLSTIITLYARATKSSSSERAPSDYISKFTDEQKQTHRELCELRDDAVAHFGSGGSYKNDWKVEIAVLTCQDNMIGIQMATRRMALDDHLIEKAKKQVKVVLDLLENELQRKVKSIHTELDIIKAKDPEIWKEIARHPLNLDVFFSGKYDFLRSVNP